MNPNASPNQEKERLHPKLQAALMSLDVNLEEELNSFQQLQKKHNSPLSQVQHDDSSVKESQSHYSSITATDNPSQGDDFPQDYLQSSEELLREVSNPKNSTQAKSATKKNPSQPRSSWRNYLLTPLGIAGILILILSGTLLSLMLIKFGEMSVRNAASPPDQTESEDESDSPPQEEEVTSDPPEESSSSEIANRPNLANDEFIELDTDNLAEAEPTPNPPETPSCGGNFYCVMVENPTEAEYKQVRQITGKAYLREFPEVGQVLQVGAFNSESSAKELLQNLEQQGIAATIYQP